MAAFEDVGPLAPVWRSMALHSKYLESFEIVHHFLLTGDGPLPQVDRHYIAIMVSTDNNIQYFSTARIVTLLDQEWIS